ncbi:MAG: response regulator transcription factor [Lachnospiraceae bacterium]|nr:response regulator transcription factor [Lachnospiraceae bacterium]
MLRIAIVEDEDVFAQELISYLARFERESGEVFRISRFSDGDEIADPYPGGFDLILMDICMRFMDGMTAAEKIRETDDRVVIIFITNRTDYAIRGYQVDALDYVLKPVNYISFAQKMSRALDRISGRRTKKIALNTRNGLLRIDIDRIRYIESHGHEMTYHTKLGDYMMRGRLQDVEKMMEADGFFRINKGCLVNLRHVDGIQDQCALVDGNRLPVSRARRSDFMAALTKTLGES